MRKKRTDLSEIGPWSEIKLDIIREYGAAYSSILSSQTKPRLKHVYIDAFSGAGFHATKDEGSLVLGSPTRALFLDPPFKEYHFIDLDKGSIETLRELVHSHTTGPYDPNSVHFYNADCNRILLTDVLPRVKYEDYRRGLCLLDPYGLDLEWQVIESAGAMQSIEIFLNFPIADMNRNVLRRDRSKVEPSQIQRMSRYWGDDSWKEVAYSREGNLFGWEEKTTNEAMADAFRQRLRKKAGFAYVPDPVPMRNSKKAIVYYLFFASQKPVASKIVREIFEKYRKRAV